MKIDSENVKNSLILHFKNNNYVKKNIRKQRS